MTQVVIRRYARPAAHPRLWAGIVIAAVAVVFGLDQSAQWLVAVS